MRRGNDSTTEPTATSTDDAGAAALEFILAGVVLLVPLVYLITALGIVQAHALGSEAGARHIARAIATAPDTRAAAERAGRIEASIADEYGMDPAEVHVDVSCDGDGACPRAGALITVRFQTAAALPLVPPVLGLDRLATIGVEAHAVQKVSRTWVGR